MDEESWQSAIALVTCVTKGEVAKIVLSVSFSTLSQRFYILSFSLFINQLGAGFSPASRPDTDLLRYDTMAKESFDWRLGLQAGGNSRRARHDGRKERNGKQSVPVRSCTVT